MRRALQTILCIPTCILSRFACNIFEHFPHLLLCTMYERLNSARMSLHLGSTRIRFRVVSSVISVHPTRSTGSLEVRYRGQVLKDQSGATGVSNITCKGIPESLV